MPTPFLGSNTFEVIPTINATGGPGGGDPLTVSTGGIIPSLTGGAGAPVGAPTYGTGSIYYDTTNYAAYIYEGAAWHNLNIIVGTPNIPGAITIPADYSYVVIEYLTINNTTLTLRGNLRIL